MAKVITVTNNNDEAFKNTYGSMIVSFKANGGTGQIGYVSDIDKSFIPVTPPEITDPNLTADVLFKMDTGNKDWKAIVTGAATFEVWGGLNK